MKIVIDSNIIFSSALSSNSRFRQILFDDNYDFVAPMILYDEIFKHIEKIYKYSKQTPLETLRFINKLFARINFYPNELIPKNIYEKAYSLCKDYDEEDTPFVALALHLKIKYWTGDKIKYHLSKSGFNDFFEY
jgi:predicted nucleic acid-binding protein